MRENRFKAGYGALVATAGLGLALAAAPHAAVAQELAAVEAAAAAAPSAGIQDASDTQVEDSTANVSSESVGTEDSSDSAGITKADAENAATGEENSSSPSDKVADESETAGNSEAADKLAAADKAANATTLPTIDSLEDASSSAVSAPKHMAAVKVDGPTGWTSDNRYITGYDSNGAAQYLKSSWVVDGHSGDGLQRYWIGADGKLAMGRLVGDNGEAAKSGYWAYALDNGYILRGKLTLGDLIYLADNDGRLLQTGWTVTGAFDNGNLQRYYVESDHAIHVGYSKSGWDHYSTDKGYVARGKYVASVGKTYLADNDGKAAVSRWAVTDQLGGGLQRYWFKADASMATNELVNPADGSGWWAYAKADGSVVRGKYDNGQGRVFLADNDGRLASGDGWLVTGAYDGGALQRYYMNAKDHAAMSGFFVASDGTHSFGMGGAGYVLRGKLSWGSFVLLSNNDGKLESNGGWLVTGAYDGGSLQRYWLAEVDDQKGFYGAKTGLFTLDDGSTHYGIVGAGYLERNVHDWHGETYYSANNDGVLIVLDNDYSHTVNAYIKFMVDMANDDSHGYDQTYRWGERGDYDCSSFVITALRSAGINTHGASYTGNMRSQILRGHFVWITDLSQRRRGDILLNESHHTAVYMGDEKLVHASANEFGSATGGKPGDQTGKEIYIRGYYDRPWNGILRYIED